MAALRGGAVSYERGTPAWHIQDSPGQILTLAFMLKSFTLFELFPLRAEAEYVIAKQVHGSGCRVFGSWFRVQGVGLRVEGAYRGISLIRNSPPP